MTKSQPIDILGGFKTKESKHTGKDKVYVEFKAPALIFDPSGVEAQLAEGVALALQVAIKENLLLGQRPDGTPLPPLKPSTIARRQYRDEQYERTDIETFKDPKRSRLRFYYRERKDNPRTQRGDAHKRAGRLRKRFHAQRLGIFDPRTQPNDRPGCESGLLANSVIAKPSRSGGWAVYFTDIRTQRDRSGKSAVERVLGDMPLVNQAVMSNSNVQHALRIMSKRMFVRKLVKVAEQALKIAERAYDIGSTPILEDERPED